MEEGLLPPAIGNQLSRSEAAHPSQSRMRGPAKGGACYKT